MGNFLVGAIMLAVILITNQAKAEDDTMVQQARKTGVVKCLPSLQGFGKYLELSSVPDFSTNNLFYTKDTDSRLYTSLMIKQYNDGSTSFATVTVSPYENSCDSLLQQIFTSNTSCTEMRETTLKSWKYATTIKDVTKLINEKGDISFYLKPVGSGCVALKTE